MKRIRSSYGNVSREMASLSKISQTSPPLNGRKKEKGFRNSKQPKRHFIRHTFRSSITKKPKLFTFTHLKTVTARFLIQNTLNNFLIQEAIEFAQLQ